MNETLFIECVSMSLEQATELKAELLALGEDFELIEDNINELARIWPRNYFIRGKINTMAACYLKLSSNGLMKTSHIPDELKDKYRR